MADYYLCGWRLRSEVPLPELVPWTGDDRPVDINVVLGAIPERLDDVVYKDAYFEIARDGTLLLKVDAVGGFWIRSPRDVVVAPRAGAAPEEVRLFFFGSVMGSLCHLRGLFPLHGSCVAIAGRGVVFCGPSGAGKSTTAGHFCARGHRLVADDVSAIDMVDGEPIVRPAFPRMKLSEAALASLALDGGAEERSQRVREKYHVDRRDQFGIDPVPLGAVIFLERAEGDEAEGLYRLTEAPAIMSRLYGEVFRPMVAEALGGPPRFFDVHSRIARGVPVYRWRRRFDFDAIDGWLARIEERVQG